MEIWYFIGAVIFGSIFAVGLLVLIIWMQTRAENKRKQELKGFSLRSGFSAVSADAVNMLFRESRTGSPAEVDDPAELKKMLDEDKAFRKVHDFSKELQSVLHFPKELPLYGSDLIPDFRNALKTFRSGASLFLFDYSYTAGSGKGSTTHKFTVFHFRSEKLKLPAFAMKPENTWDKLAALAGFQDIDFPSHPNFSEKYRLRGRQEPAVRSLMAPHVLEHFERAPKLCVEGTGDTLLVYSPDGEVQAPELSGLLHEAEAVYQLFD